MKKITLLFIVSILSCFLLSSASADDQRILFSKQYEVTRDRPDVYTDFFDAMPGEAILSVETGDGQDRRTEAYGAEIWLNGIELFDRLRFYREEQVETTVNLAETNTLEVSLLGRLESFITIKVKVPAPAPTVVLPWKSGKFLVIKLKRNTDPSPEVTISADPTSITAGGSSTLSWTSANADSVTITPDVGSVSANGTTSVSPSEITEYTITAQGPGGTATDTVTVEVSAVSAPTVTITADPSSVTAGGSSTLSWTSTNADSVTITPDVGSVSTNGTTSVSPSETTKYTITAQGPGGTATNTVTVEVSPHPAPTVTISADPTSITAGSSSTLSWTSINANSVSIDNGIGPVDLNGSISVTPTATTTYTITATGAGGTATESVTVIVHPLPTVSLSADPVTIVSGSSSQLTWSSTNADSVSITPDIGSVSDSGTINVSPSVTTTYTITANGPGGTASDSAKVTVLSVTEPIITISAAPETIALGSSTLLSWQASNVDTIHIDNGIGAVAVNDSLSVSPDHTTTYTITGSGSKGTVSAQVTVQVNGNPEPQPEGSFGTQYEDLVPEDATIDEYDPKRFSLITGVVNDLAGSPLAEVRITVHGHPEYGTVLTDTEGRFTIPVEGGGTMTLAYKHDGFITSHRQVSVPWNDIAVAETVQMLTEDPVATTITFDGNPETVVTHASTEINDEFGSRSATIVLQGDNKAYLVDEQGDDIQELKTITTRATEFAIQKSMPAALPPNSAYTYCSELSVDGAARVRFDKPVIVWVDNFLGFDVGDAVPVGYYDRDRGVWVPSDNGVVVKLLDTGTAMVLSTLWIRMMTVSRMI